MFNSYLKHETPEPLYIRGKNMWLKLRFKFYLPGRASVLREPTTNINHNTMITKGTSTDNDIYCITSELPQPNGE